MINNAKQHKPLPVYGDGTQIRDWLYVEDHCKAIDMVFIQHRLGMNSDGIQKRTMTAESRLRLNGIWNTKTG